MDEAAAATLQKTKVECEWFDFVDPAVSLILSIFIGLSVVRFDCIHKAILLMKMTILRLKSDDFGATSSRC